MKQLPIHVVIILAIIYMAYGSLTQNKEATEFYGQIVNVHDGDTATLRDENSNIIKIRLRGIDAPELAQPYGRLSQARLAQLIQGQKVRVATYGVDQYKRYIGEIYIGEKSINQQMVAEGMVWVYRKYYTGRAWLKLEKTAQQRKLGIWQGGGSNQPPWEYRKATKSAAL